MTKKLNGLLAALLLAVMTTSCVKDLDFDYLEPIMEHQVVASGSYALVMASVSYPGTMKVEVEWSRSQDFSSGESRYLTKAGDMSYSLLLNGLTQGTTYYYRMTINNGYINRTSAIGQFTTRDAEVPIATTAEMGNVGFNSAVGGGNVIYRGTTDVTERGLCWSTGHNPTIDGHHASIGSGMGEFCQRITGFESNTTYYYRAYAVNSQGVAYGNEMKFTTYTAVAGALNGVFSVSLVDKVFFSQGNLMHKPSTGAWRFADHQYSLVHVSSDMNAGSGSDKYCDVTNEYTSSYESWIDLFGWGTSGWNNGNTYYHPIDIQNYPDPIQPAYGPTDGVRYRIDLTGNYAESDWGVHNHIYNGGNHSKQWRTLTSTEWEWLLYSRNASVLNGVANARFVKAKVNNVYGLILFPDIYRHPSGVALPVGINYSEETTGWYGNSYSVSDWTKMENEGAVFLPAAGCRREGADSSVMNGVHSVNAECCYWSASSTQVLYDHSIKAQMVDCKAGYLGTTGLSRAYGCSVRLVRDVK